MPEAPWIRRCQFGIKFTDSVEEADVDYNDFNEDFTNQKTEELKI